MSERGETEMSSANGKTKVGWIGVGVMGASMCGHLLDAGYPVSVHTRTKEKAASLIERGAVWCETPRAVAEESNIIFAIVGFPSDVREVFLGGDGILAGADRGDLIIDMTTSEPSLAVEIHSAAVERGVGSIDAPVSGGDVGARQGTLSIMAGGDKENFERALPFFQVMGSNIVHAGGAGAGQHTKMVNQILIASGMVGVCEALLYAQQAGLDLAKAFKAVSGGAAGSWSLTNYGPRMLRGDFAPGFYVDHFVKDMGIALEEAAGMHVPAPGLALAYQLYVALQSQGHGRKGTQALLLALARLADVQWEGDVEVA
jgi:3-hydroxyisobutyrate dehydrogenase